MNRDKWKNPNIPLSLLALKLCEEAGEVSREITDASDDAFDLSTAIGADREYGNDELKRIHAEASHALLMAREIRNRARMELRLRKAWNTG